MNLFKKAVKHELAGGITVLAVTQFVASAAGLVRDRMLAQTFASNIGVVDAYIAAFRPSDLLFQTCIMSAMGTVLVPVLAQYFAKNDRKEMSRVLNGTMGMAALIFGLIALVLGISFPYIAHYLVQFQGPELALYIQFGRLALLTNFLFVFGNALGQYLITVQKYWIYGVTPILYTLGTILGTMFLTFKFGPLAPIYGTLAGAIIYVILRWAAVLKGGGGIVGTSN
jgi:putative peptidoglycan lipid II flippase